MTASLLERLADRLDPASIPKPVTWTTPCDIDSCDGEPHDGRPAKHARPKQIAPPGEWLIWLLTSGRGWGKTRTGAENFLGDVQAVPEVDGIPTEWAIVAETFSDCRKVCVEGPSGFLRALRARNVNFAYNKSNWRIVLASGQVVHMLGADDADAGRGLNLAGAWLEELAKWPQPAATWAEGLAPAVRIGPHPRVIVTTTPKPIGLLKEWLGRTDGTVEVTRGSTRENAANLSAVALAELEKRYAGTRIGRQELDGELLEDVEGALWTLGQIETDRAPAPTVTHWDNGEPVELVDLVLVVEGVDPAVSNTETSDEWGIVCAGKAADGHIYVLADLSRKGSVETCAAAAVEGYDQWECDRLAAEVNNGGDMVELVIRNVRDTVRVKKVHASRGKRTRAEPIAQLYEQHMVHHTDSFPELESELTTWVPDSGMSSPNRLDALVWAIHELTEGNRRRRTMRYAA